jgi:hypothetical protein
MDLVKLANSVQLHGSKGKSVDMRTPPETWPWGTYGKPATDEVKWITLGEATTEHLENIIKTESWHLDGRYVSGILAVLEKRYEVAALEKVCEALPAEGCLLPYVDLMHTMLKQERAKEVKSPVRDIASPVLYVEDIDPILGDPHPPTPEELVALLGYMPRKSNIQWADFGTRRRFARPGFPSINSNGDLDEATATDGAKHKCTCAKEVVLHQGCQCGGI